MATAQNRARRVDRLAGTLLARYVRWVRRTSRGIPEMEAIAAEAAEKHFPCIVGMWHGEFMLLPLIKPRPEKEHEDERAPVETIGALIVEQIDNARLGEGMLRRVDVVTHHSASAMANALEHQNLFLMPLWRAIGNSTWVVKGRTLPKTLSIALAVLLAIVALFVIPYDLDLKGNGTLEPRLKHDVFAAIDGEVSRPSNWAASDTELAAGIDPRWSDISQPALRTPAPRCRR